MDGVRRQQQQQQQQQQEQEVEFARHAMLGEGLVSADLLRGRDLVIDARIRIVGEEQALAALAAAGEQGAG
jgi:hypothetical protein